MRSDNMQRPTAPEHSEPDESGWRPIESAPRDGRMFLGWVSAVRYAEPDEGDPYEVDVSECDFCLWRDTELGGYVDAMSSPRADLEHVTHWMPLPEPPK